MRIIGKILVMPFALALALIVGFFKFIVIVGGTVITIVAVLAALGSLVLWWYAGFWDFLILLIVAAVIYALPQIAALLVGALAALNAATWGFIKN